ncbi:serine hydrolase domain-containing protein [Knoellia subterranea]|uniref:Beta-lactamase-related domain-containing protein n=1 Tax=Knoellia subterranea KCTC 19937 TaxID=1385521 RepID=A0A0A0JPR4_9MICO|nr:serine hydrolase domain-containing protein [Knoellia subterranea]KGN37581.1 hypothetical protein N803_13815 [Knoellia subterranea KCTC 19937]
MKLFKKRQAHVLLRGGEVVSRDLGKDYDEGKFVEWGSITKTVTAAAAAVLVDEGRLSYDTPAGELVGGRLPESITVDTLARHTSGLPRVHPGMKGGINHDPYEGTDGDFLTDLLASFDESLLESPGTVSYSNLGYAVLGRIVETVTGEPWLPSVRSLVLEPWGLAEVTTRPPSDRWAAIKGFDGKPHTPWSLDRSAYAPAGALWSTLDVLAEYGQTTVERGGYDDPRRGWQETEGRWWHNGQTRDSGSCLVLDPNADVVVATHALARLPGSADRLADKLIRELDEAA